MPWGDKMNFLVVSVLVYSCYWILFRKRGAVDFFRAVSYWIGPGVKRRQGCALQKGSAEDRVLRYLSEVYGSGISLPWVNPLLACFGIVGCLAALIILVNGLCSLYLTSAALSRYWIGWLESVMLVGVFLPILVMFFGKWQKTVILRRLGAVRRIFGNIDRAAAVAYELRNQYPDASDVPTTWAFPIRPDYAAFEAGKPFLFAYGFLVLSSLYVAQTASRLVETVILAIGIYFVPVVFHGVLAAFGGWSQKRDDLMAYPVSVFLRDIRILEKQRKLLSFD